MAKNFIKTNYDRKCPKVRKYVLEKYNSKCAYCGCDLDYGTLKIDHIVPLVKDERGSRRGDNTLQNYNPSCGQCNTSKSNMQLEEWRKQLIYKIAQVERESSTYRMLSKFGLVGVLKYEVKFYYETL